MTAHDLRHSLRALSRHRTFTALSITCLSLGIGTYTTAFTFVNALLLRPVPVAAPEQLVEIRETRVEDPAGGGPVSFPNFADLLEPGSGLVEMAGARRINLRLSDGGETERYSGAFVSWNLFHVLGVAPSQGRGLVEADEIGDSAVVVVSHTLWEQRFGSDPGLVGRAITVNGTPRMVIGIMPDLSHPALPGVLRSTRLWVPFGHADREAARDRRELSVCGRLRSGVTPELLAARLGAAARTLSARHPAENEGWTVAVRPLRVGFSTTTRAMLLMAMGAVTFVLLIACANVANLALARATARRRELATRLALGAPRGRIVRQLLTESLLVALLSVPPGIAIAFWGVDLLLGESAPLEMARFISIDRRVLLFSIGLAFLTSALSGLAPALHAIRRLQHNVLTEGGGRDAAGGPPHTHLSQGLVIVEVSLCLMLLVGASLLIKSFQNALAAEGGFDTSSILALEIEAASEGVDPAGPGLVITHAIVDRLGALPGVTHAAAANLMPLRDGGVRAAIVPDALQGGADVPPAILLGGVTSRFFQVLGVPILRGRSFSDVEGRSRSRIAIVNKTMARRLWPDQDPVGRRFRRAEEDDWFTVIGVSDDILTWDLSNRPLPTAYVPYAHVPAHEPAVFVRASGDPSDLTVSVRSAIDAAAPATPILFVRTMTEVHESALSRGRTLAALFATLGVIALFLGAVGVYGVLSYFVSQRRHEIGIRAALGADRGSLVRLFVSRGLAMTLVGIVCGLGGAWALARVIRGRLHEVSATDPLSFVGATILLIAVGTVASYFPARRAADVDPLVAIRE